MLKLLGVVIWTPFSPLFSTELSGGEPGMSLGSRRLVLAGLVLAVPEHNQFCKQWWQGLKLAGLKFDGEDELRSRPGW
ncbi:hypothetical protein BY996DRAFT_6567765 [Phakopsora pachyrhizi]|nr:hypothetical protein BY996DRAFT_6567765 [Phakopsora pachyrhizi]